MMLSLILKDVRVNWMYQLLSLAAPFAMSMLSMALMQDDGGQISVELFMGLVLLGSSGVSLLFMKIDEIFRADEIYASLPVTRSQIVKARYVTSFGNILLALAVCILAAQPGAYFQDGFDDPGLKLIYHPTLWLLMLAILVLMNCMAYPFYFKYGLGKGALVIGLVQILMLASGYFSYRILRTRNLKAYAQNFLEWLSDLNEVTLIVGFLIFLLLVIIGSINLSIHFYKKRDL